ncbi:SpoIIE family protein phosphatase [Streptomyces sp. B6B3]|uniref:SpoIIE family protein phosphatase n=1 Tax=Streptomyces sp. B6B3 TaxID=3153570 RepID=UPI00325E38D6
MLDGLPELPDLGVYLVDHQGRIVEVNPQAEELLGRPAADLLGQDAHDLLHRDQHGNTIPRAECLMMRGLLGERTARNDQGWFARGDGTPLPMSWLVAPCRFPDGEDGALVVFHRSSPDDEPAEWVERDPSTPLTELERLTLLAETTTLLTSTLVIEEALRRLVQLLVPRLGDWAVVDLIDEGGEVWRTTVVGHEEGALARHADMEGPMPPVPPESPMPLSRALRGASATLVGPETYQGPPDSGITVIQQELFRATGMHSAVITPIHGLREVLGALTLGRSQRAGAFGTTELSLLNDIARRAGLALDNARLYQRQRRVAETMQRHLLPQLPRVPGVRMTARYLPAPQSSQVGGDWYDAFVLPNGPTALAIGDVVGHDLDAAAGMAQIRNMLRAYAWSHETDSPSRAVERLDQAMVQIVEASMATMVFGWIERVDGWWRLQWTNAGHPPPMLVGHDGQTQFLDAGHNVLLGTGITSPRSDAVITLPPLATLVLYTDGLIESPGHSLDEGLARLRRHGAALAHRPLDVFCDLLLDRVRPTDNEDDVAMLAVRMPATP